ncbi:exodeoxyribonuclease III [Bartonella henselae]|uniref:Exodeoxyribonuclease III n=2 Tax=Bartonella TaxID=773 RepID=X5MHQ9_BARHN|nr:exodeoxyribonuclease III [Bartonella henselae]MDM9997295.1 exodeoxyribonuclease III [Bartonella henselae]OLL49064.1 exodeoxyribonuclease III [Bartonella henselae]OLL49465.1 exodeoxyribonuclease III [Bartonella henselae]OLL50830.1 exodeoxyribonuclease III [Bartonella henselae]OLL58682.1 exodeoxyribonuclease III [Bartonella henselae]
MKIVTWNIAGIKARHETLYQWLQQNRPDIVCLQEIKSTDKNFPRDAIESLGYHIETHGQKSFNGVAILSKKTPDEVIRQLPGNDKDEQTRYIEAVYSTNKGVIRVASLYLPNGNPINSEKYPYKMEWMERLYTHAKSLLKYEEPLVLAGDYNVIPTPLDAKTPKEWSDDALFLPQTRQAFQRIIHLGFYDAIRNVTDTPSFSFWDFQAAAWRKNNGIRIDHLLLSPEAVDQLICAYSQKEVRGYQKPSDHTPVWIDLNFN